MLPLLLEKLRLLRCWLSWFLLTALVVSSVSTFAISNRSLGDIFTNDIPIKDHNIFHQFRLLAGILLIVQGFETSRYLGDEYNADTRINTMRQAQFISGVIYVVFVLLALPFLTHLEGTDPDETAIIGLARLISPVLPILLVVAAVMSQFSASVADTIGGGGLMSENTGKKLNNRRSYLIITFAAILLVWTADIFQLISIASRAFAFYYLLQSINAWLTAGKCYCGWRCCLERICLAFCISILTFIITFGHSAE